MFCSGGAEEDPGNLCTWLIAICLPTSLHFLLVTLQVMAVTARVEQSCRCEFLFNRLKQSNLVPNSGLSLVTNLNVVDLQGGLEKFLAGKVVEKFLKGKVKTRKIFRNYIAFEAMNIANVFQKNIHSHEIVFAYLTF